MIEVIFMIISFIVGFASGFYAALGHIANRQNKYMSNLFDGEKEKENNFTTDKKGRGLYKGAIIGIKAKEAAEKKEE